MVSGADFPLDFSFLERILFYATWNNAIGKAGETTALQ